MNNKHTTDFAMILSGYLFEYLPIQIGVSENTYKSYYDTIRLFLDYCTKEHNLKRHKLKISDINKDIVISFYDWIESERECSPSTRNQRRAGISLYPWRYSSFSISIPSCLRARARRDLTVPSEIRRMDAISFTE